MKMNLQKNATLQQKPPSKQTASSIGSEQAQSSKEHTPKDENIDKLVRATLESFQQTSQKYFLFNIGFFSLLLVEFILIALFFPALVKGYFLGFGVAIIFFTLLLYFILRLYYEEQKPEELQELLAHYIHDSKKLIPFPENSQEGHLELASFCFRLKEKLEQQNNIDPSQPPATFSFYTLSPIFSFLTPFLSKFAQKFYIPNLIFMQELVLHKAIGEHIQLIKKKPLSLEIHAATANAYVSLATLYSATKHKTCLSAKMHYEYKLKSKNAFEAALQEFKILNEYAPNDAWVHEQLATSFHSLAMPHEEIKEYETILQLTPTNQHIRFKLGKLYFEQKENAKGLKLYEELSNLDTHLASQLIQYYSPGT